MPAPPPAAACRPRLPSVHPTRQPSLAAFLLPCRTLAAPLRLSGGRDFHRRSHASTTPPRPSLSRPARPPAHPSPSSAHRRGVATILTGCAARSIAEYAITRSPAVGVIAGPRPSPPAPPSPQAAATTTIRASSDVAVDHEASVVSAPADRVDRRRRATSHHCAASRPPAHRRTRGRSDASSSRPSAVCAAAAPAITTTGRGAGSSSSIQQ